MYAILTLKHQKHCQDITGFLIDCHHIMFIQVVKDESEEGPYRVLYSNQFNLSSQINTKYLRALLSTLYCHHLTIGLNVKMNDLIAYTSISNVFGVCDDDVAVVKILLIRLIASSSTAMLLRPRRVKTFKKCHKPVSFLADIVDKLKVIHENWIVHGDLRCREGMVQKWTKNATFIFKLIRLTTTSTFDGRWKPQIFTDYRDDLFTFIQSIYIHLNKDYALQALQAFGNNIENPNQVILFWDKVFVDEWRIARDYYDNLNYDGLRNFIANL
ncbi:13060_t:CDS:2 [Funneliformis caledonium]|uniref:13060_t:CDS:1 n=1 Tax=Funneliformis caledonium TaxID=1117310 RepID=A0A9N9AL53_9GLOM|nr:13060_t:CDS:2 [Funneliformis caledonium]